MATAQLEQTRIPTGIWRSDPVHSHVGFAVKHMVVATFRGAFREFDVTLDNGKRGTKLYGAVPVESVEVRDESLYGHLLSPDFFDAERHPEITFASTVIGWDGDDLLVEGDLTIKGVMKRVEARGSIVGPIEHPAGGERIGIDLETTVDRTDFGLDWNAPVPSGGFAVEDHVTLSVHLELAKEE